MREIKFRGKRVDNGEWVYGYLAKYRNYRNEIYTAIIPIIDETGEAVPSEIASVNPETVGQFIGIKDKFGNEIYDGDIVECGDGYKYVVKYTDEDVASCGCCYGEFSGIGFVGEEVNGRLWCGNKFRCQLNSECEVIGNIWDNPELLKKGSENEKQA